MSQHESSPRRFQLIAAVELLAGPNETPLLYLSESKSYVRLSAAGVQVVQLLQSRGALTAEEIALELASSTTPECVTAFLLQLETAGALVQAIPVLTPWQRLRQRFLLRPRLELALWHPNRPLATNLLQAMQTKLGAVLGRLIMFAALLTAMLVTYAVLKPHEALPGSHVSWWFLLGALVLHTAGHEMAHALVSSYYGVKVREIGVALLYFFIPVAYTDRTDAYRLRQFHQRACISAAGPVFDLLLTGLSALLSLTATGWLSYNFRMLMWLQLAGFVTNLNPLLPGDAYHVLEAWFGALNFRRRAFTVLWRRLTWRVLPPHLQHLTRRQQCLHFSYAALAIGYLVSLAMTLLHQFALRAQTLAYQ